MHGPYAAPQADPGADTVSCNCLAGYSKVAAAKDDGSWQCQVAAAAPPACKKTPGGDSGGGGAGEANNYGFGWVTTSLLWLFGLVVVVGVLQYMVGRAAAAQKASRKPPPPGLLGNGTGGPDVGALLGGAGAEDDLRVTRDLADPYAAYRSGSGGGGGGGGGE
eukprot:SAG22_NODE_1680_length_3824_cov_1.537181_1_plen_163_part_00